MIASCRRVAGRLPLTGVDVSLGETLDRHVAECLVCQAEMARYRKLNRALAGLASEVVDAPAGLAAAVEIAIDRGVAPGDAPRRLGRAAAATGALAATAAGVVAVTLWRRTRQAA